MKRIAALAAVAAFAVAPAALAAGTLTGTYRTTIKHNTQLGGHLNGKWKLKLRPGHYKVWQNGKLVVTGVDTVTRHKITLTDTGGPGKCTGTGIYKFRLRQDRLSFTQVSDSKSCAGREAVLKYTFKKVS